VLTNIYLNLLTTPPKPHLKQNSPVIFNSFPFDFDCSGSIVFSSAIYFIVFLNDVLYIKLYSIQSYYNKYYNNKYKVKIFFFSLTKKRMLKDIEK
jgi:hypothetical protein